MHAGIYLLRLRLLLASIDVFVEQLLDVLLTIEGTRLPSLSRLSLDPSLEKVRVSLDWSLRSHELWLLLLLLEDALRWARLLEREDTTGVGVVSRTFKIEADVTFARRLEGEAMRGLTHRSGKRQLIAVSVPR